ncbi:hypothetical protein [Brevibacillus dissolubilis]|uniref:hypothetical protein n=1 Tax=Brevibacillus dissolubilis TaxID=1844116 RepID=UPI0011169E01|nr:hypothetical protein [Brevibacillus dissolubilis]
MSTAVYAIALYRPHAGQEQALMETLKTHIPTLRRENLITDREAVKLQAADGTIIEMFEWRSVEAKDAAHTSPAVMGIWEKMMEVAEMTSLSTLAEAGRPFPTFTPIE